MKAAGGGFVVFDARVLNQRSETVQQGEWTVLVKSKG
jgi:acyl dehydratase